MSRVAVVTGGASGIGLAICQHLAKDGHRVAVLDVNGEGAQTAASEIAARGVAAVAHEVDVADPDSVTNAMTVVRDTLGPIQILVTSAAIAPWSDFVDITLDEWNRMIAVNLTGTFLCIQAVVPDMVAAGWGRVVTISSGSGQQGTPRLAHYSASKGGVISLTKSLAREYGPAGITVNTVSPGVVATPLFRSIQARGDMPPDELAISVIPLRRLGEPDDLAAATAFLCSDEAGYITGQVVAVNGGLVI